jgi:hypothetical protein
MAEQDLLTCPSCGNEDDRLLKIRARYVGTPSELPECPMCLGCALEWPFAIADWSATVDGTITLRHRAVIGEWS